MIMRDVKFNYGRMRYAPTRTCDYAFRRILCLGKACLALTKARFGKPVAGSLGTIIGSFKSATTRYTNRSLGTPGSKVWHRNYYEHIIRNEKELYNVRRYIRSNPLKWMIDDDILYDTLFSCMKYYHLPENNHVPGY
jgi:hypothetical protein